MTRDIRKISALDDLMARVGYVLLCWGWMEQALDLAVSQLAQADSESDGAERSTLTFGKKLDRWRDLHKRAARGNAQHTSSVETLFASVAEAQTARNAICHGLKGASADTEAGEARVMTSNRGTDAEYTASTLHDLARQIDRARLQIPRLTRAVAGKK